MPFKESPAIGLGQVEEETYLPLPYISIMAPPRSKPPPDDSRSEASSTKEKAGTSTLNPVNGKNRRVAGNAAGGSTLRDVVNAGPSGISAGNSVPVETTQGVSGNLRISTMLF